MNNNTINIYDPVWGQVSPDLIPIVREFLNYEYSRYRPSMSNQTTLQIRYLLDTMGWFNTGYLSRILKNLKEQNISPNIFGYKQTIFPNPSNITLDLRNYQKEAVDAALSKQRGVIMAPTGSGKTRIIAAIAQALAGNKTVIFAHNRSIFKQIETEIKSVFPENDVGIITSISKTSELKMINIAMAKTFENRFQPNEYRDDIKCLIIDEVHHLSNFECGYAWLAKFIFAPYRFGLTATLPSTVEGKLAVEGLIGDVIYEIPSSILITEGYIAKPNIRLLPIPTNKKYMDSTFEIAYDVEIVNNIERHKAILKEADYYVSQGKSVLILVVRKEHMDRIREQASKFEYVVPHPVVGDTPAYVRDMIKNELKYKNIHCVIATAVFREGVDIPNLDVVINAAGHKSEIMTLQSIGRGLCRTKEKDSVIIVDCIDRGNKHLALHSLERINTYVSEGWL